MNHAEYQREYAIKNRDRLRSQRKKYYIDNKESILRRNREWRRSHPEMVKARHKRYYAEHKKEYNEKARKCYFKKDYGITIEQYNDMVKDAGGKCQICRRALKLHVDHNHATGKVRGILCFACNAALGGMRDRIWVLERAIEYLEKNGTTF